MRHYGTRIWLTSEASIVFKSYIFPSVYNTYNTRQELRGHKNTAIPKSYVCVYAPYRHYSETPGVTMIQRATRPVRPSSAVHTKNVPVIFFLSTFLDYKLFPSVSLVTL